MSVARKKAGRRITKGALRKAAAKGRTKARAGRAVALPASLEMNATEFKAVCLQLMEEVKRTGKSVVITKRGKPVAQLGPPPARAGKSIFGCMAGRGRILGDIVAPAITKEQTDRRIEKLARQIAQDPPA